MNSADFALAADAFASVVDRIRPGQWEGPGLGEWTVRDLVGHGSRSLVTIEEYLADPPDPNDDLVDDPLPYLSALRAVDSAAVAQRGRDAGAALGHDPAAAVRALVERVTGLVAATSERAAVKTLFGPMTLRGYLPTRTFELTVHTLDLAAALGTDPPAGLDAAVAASLGLVAAIVARTGAGTMVLRALTGRGSLPVGFTVV